MKISTLLYTIKQGFVNIFRNKWYSLASIATISACLFLFGMFYAIVMNFQHVVESAEEGVCISVLFVEGTTEERMKEINDMIDARDEVARTEFISADQAWEEFSRDYLQGYTEGFPENPLVGMDTIEVYMTDVEKQEDLAVYIESITDVDHVNRSLVVADTLSGVNLMIGYVSFGIIGILLAVSIFLISNTIAVGISIRSEEINIMKYVGATDFFVRSPFVLEGMLIGLVGAAIPLGFIYSLYNTVLSYLVERFAMLSSLLNFLSVEEIFKNLTPVSLAVGVGIGFLGSMKTVRKHLRV
ncbi:MAG: permease-like cell division protein FtsX [Lachnospiraceae bacterium]|nr:permease-like cell division protein FtsX [Lachnospiraceae bacterium]